MSLSIRSGGQTGVDRGALDAAVARGIPYCGWCPAGGWAEDLGDPPGLLAHYQLTPTPSARPEQRSAWNVRDSDATLVLIDEAGGPSPGTQFTIVCAELVFAKPFLVINLADERARERALEWLGEQLVAHPNGFVLNIAGPRESEAPGIYAAAKGFVETL